MLHKTGLSRIKRFLYYIPLIMCALFYGTCGYAVGRDDELVDEGVGGTGHDDAAPRELDIPEVPELPDRGVPDLPDVVVPELDIPDEPCDTCVQTPTTPDN